MLKISVFISATKSAQDNIIIERKMRKTELASVFLSVISSQNFEIPAV